MSSWASVSKNMIYNPVKFTDQFTSLNPLHFNEAKLD